GADEGVFRLVRQGRRVRRLVIAGERKHAAPRRRPGGVGGLDHVAGAGDARALTVPHGEVAVILGAREEIGLLAAPDGGGGEILVDARIEADVVLLEKALGLPEILVEAAQGRAAIARDESGGVEAGS